MTCFKKTFWQWKYLLFSSATSPWVWDVARWGDEEGWLTHTVTIPPVPNEEMVMGHSNHGLARVWWAIRSNTRDSLCLPRCMQYIHLDKPITSVSVFSPMSEEIFQNSSPYFIRIVTKPAPQRHLWSRGWLLSLPNLLVFEQHIITQLWAITFRQTNGIDFSSGDFNLEDFTEVGQTFLSPTSCWDWQLLVASLWT